MKTIFIIISLIFAGVSVNYSTVNFEVKKGIDDNISSENDGLYYATLPDENGIIDYEDDYRFGVRPVLTVAI